MCTQGARIRKARKNLQLSLQQLGQVLNVSKQYLSKIEKNGEIDEIQFKNYDNKFKEQLSNDGINANYILVGKGNIFISTK